LSQEEQYRLKQELADIAVVINMEAQKGQEKEQDFQKYANLELLFYSMHK